MTTRQEKLIKNACLINETFEVNNIEMGDRIESLIYFLVKYSALIFSDEAFEELLSIMKEEHSHMRKKAKESLKKEGVL